MSKPFLCVLMNNVVPSNNNSSNSSSSSSNSSSSVCCYWNISHCMFIQAQYVFIHKALLEAMDLMAMIKSGTTGSHYSQGYTPVFINREI